MYQISSMCALCILYMKMNWQCERIGVKMLQKKKKKEKKGLGKKQSVGANASLRLCT